MGKNGRIWLSDRAYARFWPSWFEYIAAKYPTMAISNICDSLWDAMVPLTYTKKSGFRGCLVECILIMLEVEYNEDESGD